METNPSLTEREISPTICQRIKMNEDKWKNKKKKQQ